MSFPHSKIVVLLIHNMRQSWVESRAAIENNHSITSLYSETLIVRLV